MAKTNKLPAGWSYSNWNAMYWRGARAVMRFSGGWAVILDRNARFPFSPSNILDQRYATQELAMEAADALP
jgi:hypothetical protein